MQLDSFIDVEPSAAAALTRDLPRDQALGLRLLAMARAAAGMHMGGAAIGAGCEDRARMDDQAQPPATSPQLLRSQASGLLALTPTRFPSPDSRFPETLP